MTGLAGHEEITGERSNKANLQQGVIAGRKLTKGHSAQPVGAKLPLIRECDCPKKRPMILDKSGGAWYNISEVYFQYLTAPPDCRTPLSRAQLLHKLITDK